MEARNGCVRIVCRTAEQRDRLLHLGTIVGKEVITTKPWSLTKEREATKPANSTWKKGVITRVPSDFTEPIIKEDSGAVMTRRITKMMDGQVTPTTGVILSFEETLPKEVFINFRRFKVSNYVPTPIRCNRCQAFGHKTTQCKKPSVVCSRCSARGHDFINCPAQQSEPKCANCGGNHNAAYRGCPKFKQVRQILTVSAKQGMSYRDAAMQWKKSAQEKERTSTDTATPSAATKESSSNYIQKLTSTPAQSRHTVMVSTGMQTEETGATTAATSTSSGDVLTNDQIMCLLNTTTTALLWLVKQIPAETTGQEQIVQQLHIVTNVIKKWKTRREGQPASSGKPTQPDVTTADADHRTEASHANMGGEEHESEQASRTMQ